MALSNQEKAKIVVHLGWPAKTIIEDSTDYSKTFVDRLDNLGSDFDMGIRLLLSKIAAVDEKLSEGIERLAVKQIGDIVLTDDEMYRLRKEKKKLIKELSSLLDLEVISSHGIGITV